MADVTDRSKGNSNVHGDDEVKRKRRKTSKRLGPVTVTFVEPDKEQRRQIEQAVRGAIRSYIKDHAQKELDND